MERTSNPVAQFQAASKSDDANELNGLQYLGCMNRLFPVYDRIRAKHGGVDRYSRQPSEARSSKKKRIQPVTPDQIAQGRENVLLMQGMGPDAV